MTFNIHPDIPAHWKESFFEFERKYGCELSKEYPQLNDMTIEVSELNPEKDKLTYDKNNPIQANVKDITIGYSDSAIDLVPDERLALIAHEIGHLVYKGKYQNDLQRLEIECDQIAVNLGMKAGLKEALVRLKENRKPLNLDPITQELFGSNLEEESNKLDQRINSL